MRCRRVKLASGEVGFVCGSADPGKRCSVCGSYTRPYLLCDWKLTGPKAGKTCDRVLCLGCAREVGPDKHLCEPHGKLWDRDPRNPRRVPTPEDAPG